MESLKIEFKYLLREKTGWDILNILPSEYFDIDESEKYKINSVPRFLKLYEYLEHDVKVIKCIELSIYNDKDYIRIQQAFWNKGRNFIIDHKQEINNKFYHEYIIESLIDEEESKFEIIRIKNNDNVLIPSYHAFITDNIDGSQEEDRMDIG